MWAQAGFSPDDFWHQTPYHFQMVMEGVRKRLTLEHDARIRQAYDSGAFAGLAYHGKLKPIKNYIGSQSQSRKMSNQEMLANMRILAQRANRKTKRD